IVIDKNQITKVCIDDFAIKKRQRYGTIMVDIETHKIIDLIPSRDLADVITWLKTFPNLKIVSRDGSITFRNAIAKAHPVVIQISDRFHVIKNLMDYVKQAFQRLLPTSIKVSHLSGNQANPAYLFLTLQEKIAIAQKLKKSKVSTSTIAKQLGMNMHTLQKYITLSKQEVPLLFMTQSEKESAERKNVRKSSSKRYKSFIPKE
ncbi:transposase, partial [Bacillus cereus]|uniref:transposase n=1 Tax=Bacillus cereus TaxID=1396 RepID=UPI003012CC0A